MAIRNFELDKKIINAANKEFLKEDLQKHLYGELLKKQALLQEHFILAIKIRMNYFAALFLMFVKNLMSNSLI